MNEGTFSETKQPKPPETPLSEQPPMSKKLTRIIVNKSMKDLTELKKLVEGKTSALGKKGWEKAVTAARNIAFIAEVGKREYERRVEEQKNIEKRSGKDMRGEITEKRIVEVIEEGVDQVMRESPYKTEKKIDKGPEERKVDFRFEKGGREEPPKPPAGETQEQISSHRLVREKPKTTGIVRYRNMTKEQDRERQIRADKEANLAFENAMKLASEVRNFRLDS